MKKSLIIICIIFFIGITGCNKSKNKNDIVIDYHPMDDEEEKNGPIVDKGTSKIEVIECAGNKESAYVEFSPVEEATGYNVYVKKEYSSGYTKIDGSLIRKYIDEKTTYYRADVVGLSAGIYQMRVAPIINNKESDYLTVSDIVVDSYIREGFAFSSNSSYKSASGAYNDDGTLKSNANVLYVSARTAKTVTLNVQTSSNASEEITGLQAIINARQKGYDKTPLDIRILGTIQNTDMDYFGSSGEGLQIKGKSSYSEMNITLEGIGEDATIYGFGFLIKNCGNVEIRNIGIMKFMNDGISIDTDNCNIWVHNVDFFYGNPGGASDQVKGDGSIDLESNSTYISISYCHFWDSGKCSLCGRNNELTTSYITYDHNWFDHSDSRHARIRTMSVHMYNNYFDGNSKYGVGVTMGASCFVEGNYFNNCNYPMMSSLQGTDATGDGTFSNDNGGIIKAYNNVINGASKLVYANSNDGGATTSYNSTSFDAYLASSKDEIVPSTYVTVAGGTAYNNFDTNSSIMYSYSLTDVNDVPKEVKANAGRLNGGDFTFEFITSDNESYDMNSSLLTAINNYHTKLVEVYVDSPNSDNLLIDAQNAIAAIPQVITLTTECHNAIVAARNAYDLLSTALKDEISDALIVSAQNTYSQLEVYNVINLIESIGIVTSDSGEKIVSANIAYGALTSTQKNSVTNYSNLIQANVEFDNYAVENVINLIDDIGTVTLQSQDVINHAKSAYNDLSDSQKSSVTNYDILLEAIEAYNEFGLDVYTYNWTNTSTNSTLFNISGNTSNSKGSADYGGTNYSICLKIESATNISFELEETKTLTLVFGGTTSAVGKQIKIDGSSKDILSDQTLVIELAKGTHIITKDDSIYLFYIQLS